MIRPLITLFAIVFSVSALAGKLNISLDPNDLSKMPASDLTYQGNQIDELQAYELKKSGVDISNLNPYESELWSDNKLSIDNYSTLDYPQRVNVKFKNFKASPREIFRAQVIDPRTQKQFVITASLDNHTNILRASMLRLLGYDLDVPKFYKKMTIKFDNEEQKKKFIELVGEETLTKRDKWVLRDISKTKLSIKGFTLEPAELRNVNIHLPVMIRSRQVDRRSFRALFPLYAITDFPQKINSVSWKIGGSFNGSLGINHPYASEFRNVDYDDMRWMLRKLVNLSREEISNALNLSAYPEDIHALLLEKLLSRIKFLAQYFNLGSNFVVNDQITLDNVVAGRLIRGNYNDYVVEFFEKDPDNPYRFSEVFRLFRTQILYSSLSGLLDTAITEFVPGVYTENAAQNVQDQISEFRQNNPSNGGVLPLNAFASPLASGRVFANRNIVFGQYLGSTAPIQLVDSVGAEASLGVYTSITGIGQTVMPSATANVSYGRTYVHVRAMPDLRTASRQHIKKLLIPRVMKKLGRVIKDEYECSISEEPYVEESTLNDSEIYYVKYDRSFENAREKALKLRQELIDSGIEAGKILLLVINREELCTDQIAETRTQSMASFLKEFALNETFIINDTLRLTGNLNAPIPVTGVPGLTVSVGSEHSWTRLKSVMIKKTDYGMEVTISNQKDLRNGHREGLNYFIEILSMSNSRTRGNLMSKVYKIKMTDIDEEEQKKALRSIREVLVSNNHDIMKENYNPTNLDHDVWAKIRTLRFLWFRSDRVKMNHTVDIVVPNKEGQNFSLKERTRKLFSTFHTKRSGNDFQSFVDRALGSISGIANFISVGSSNGDPGQTFMGTGKKLAITTESELTENFPLDPITRIEHSWTGWRKKTRKLEKIFKKIENMYTPFTNTDLIDRTQFYSTPKLRSYDIKNTLILYPSAFSKIETRILKAPEHHAINTLLNVYGVENWKTYCQRAIEFFGERGPQEYYGERKYDCVPPAVKSILKLRFKLPTERMEKTRAINKMYREIVKDFEIASFLKWLGEKHFFSSSRITGFRENHHIGFIEYISDTVGKYNLEQGTGVFDRIGTQLGISPFELRAMGYTPGL